MLISLWIYYSREIQEACSRLWSIYKKLKEDSPQDAKIQIVYPAKLRIIPELSSKSSANSCQPVHICTFLFSQIQLQQAMAGLFPNCSWPILTDAYSNVSIFKSPGNAFKSGIFKTLHPHGNSAR